MSATLIPRILVLPLIVREGGLATSTSSGFSIQPQWMPARIAGSMVRNQLAPSWPLGESTGSLPAAGLADDLLEL